MTPEKQRIAIATACGWKDIRRQNLYAGDRDLYGNKLIGGEKHRNRLPDYLNDLNAIAEARKILTPDQQLQFSIYVGKSVTRMLRVNQAAWMDFCLIDATAKCQSEAFLKALGLWEEEQ